MSGICPVLFVQNLSRIFSCPEYVWKKFLEFFMSGICPVYLSRFCPCPKNQTNSGHEKKFSGHISDMQKIWTATLIIFLNIFRTFSGHEK
jgi:hypothetical protein